MKRLKNLLAKFTRLSPEKQQKAIEFLSGLIEKEQDEEIKDWLIQLKINLKTKQERGVK